MVNKSCESFHVNRKSLVTINNTDNFIVLITSLSNSFLFNLIFLSCKHRIFRPIFCDEFFSMIVGLYFVMLIVRKKTILSITQCSEGGRITSQNYQVAGSNEKKALALLTNLV